VTRIGKTNQFYNAEAEIETRAWREHARDCKIIVQTQAQYRFSKPNVNGGRAAGARPGGMVRLKLSTGDVSRLGMIWGRIFDLAASVVQNKPLSISWEMDTSGLCDDDDGWLQGAVAAVVHTVAHELDLSVTSRGGDR